MNKGPLKGQHVLDWHYDILLKWLGLTNSSKQLEWQFALDVKRKSLDKKTTYIEEMRWILCYFLCRDKYWDLHQKNFGKCLEVIEADTKVIVPQLQFYAKAKPFLDDSKNFKF